MTSRKKSPPDQFSFFCFDYVEASGLHRFVEVCGPELNMTAKTMILFVCFDYLEIGATLRYFEVDGSLF
jgi:hypothetical protein